MALFFLSAGHGRHPIDLFPKILVVSVLILYLLAIQLSPEIATHL